MRVVDLEGNYSELKISNDTIYKKRTNQSKLHNKAKEIVVGLFGTVQVYEEVTVCVAANKKLYLDLFIPELNLALEVHGKQHYSFTSMFHKNKKDFLVAINNDKLKREWCNLNNIKLIELPYNETKNWKEIINGNIS